MLTGKTGGVGVETGGNRALSALSFHKLKTALENTLLIKKKNQCWLLINIINSILEERCSGAGEIGEPVCGGGWQGGNLESSPFQSPGKDAQRIACPRTQWIQIQPLKRRAARKKATGLMNEFAAWGSWGNSHGPAFIIWVEVPTRVHRMLALCGQGGFDPVNPVETAK